MALEQVVSGLDPNQAHAAYYALQEKLNIGWAANQLIAISLPLLLFFTGWGSTAYTFLLRNLRVWPAAAFAFFFLIAFVTSVAQFAVIYNLLTIKAELETSVLPPLMSFLLAMLPSSFITSSVAAIVGIALCYVLRKRTRLTWLWLSILTTGLAGSALFLAPYFSETEPLGATSIESEISALAARVGIPADRIAKENCTNSSECPPGHVIGIGPTRLMLLDSRLTSRTPADQLLQVVAHEAKHYLLDNTLKPLALLFIIFGTVFLLTQALSSLILSHHKKKNTSETAGPAIVPLFYGLALTFFVLLQPAITTIRRHVEFEADRFGLELNRDNQALIDIMRVDAASNPMLFEYTPVTKYFRATHPDISTRITFAETYQPWSSNQPMVYGQHFED